MMVTKIPYHQKLKILIKLSEKNSVIIIDDDQDTLDVTVELLELEEIKILGTANNGKQAVELFEKNRPQLVVLDIMMPYFDGFYAMEKIWEIDPTANFLVITADISEETKEKLQKIEQLKPISVLFKPYEINDVVKEVKKIFQSLK